MKNLKQLLKDQRGQTTIEYALATIVVILVLVAILALGNTNPLYMAISDAFTKVSAEVANV